MSVYLDRFLNIPSAKPPKEESAEGFRGDPVELLALLDQQHQVTEAAEWVAAYLDRGGEKGPLFNALGLALLREDAEFHTFQVVEACLAEHDRGAEEESELAQAAERSMILAVTRYLAAHAPTDRQLLHTARIAWRLHRGEKLYEQG